MNATVESFTFDSGKPGPVLVMLGAVHGNEKCGAKALLHLKSHIESGGIKIAAGKLVLVPIANPEAYAADKRFMERNLNRCLYPKPEGERTFYEDHLDHQICAVLDQADYLLDIHSYTAGGDPFVIIGGESRKEKDFAEALGVANNFVWGWGNAFKKSGLPGKESQGTTEYARTNSKNATGVTLECGQHRDPKAPEVAYAAALHALKYLGLMDEAAFKKETSGLPAPAAGKRQFAKMITVIKNEPVTLARPFRHFEKISAGEVLARRADGSEIKASADGYAILPNPAAEKGAETVYLAVDEEPSFTATRRELSI